jgi:hypothetical protein
VKAGFENRLRKAMRTSFMRSLRRNEDDWGKLNVLTVVQLEAA